MPKTGPSREPSAAPSEDSAHSSRSSTPTITIETKTTETPASSSSRHVRMETPEAAPSESRLRQRFKSVRDEIGKSMEDISVRIRSKGDGNYKVRTS